MKFEKNIKKLETFRPDLIILDVWLGPNSELDGIELLKKIYRVFQKFRPKDC